MKDHEINQNIISVRLFEVFMKRSHNAVAVLDTNLNYIKVNQNWRKDFLLEGKELVGKNHLAIYPDTADVDPEWASALESALAGKTVHKDKFKLNFHKYTVYIKCQITPWQDDNGVLGGIIILSEVITSTVLVERELEYKRTQLQELSDTLNDLSKVTNTGMWIYDLEQRAIGMSNVMCNILELPRSTKFSLESLIGCFHENDQDMVAQAFENAHSDAAPWELKLRVITANTHEDIWVRLTGQAVIVDGKTIVIKGFLQDIGFIKKAMPKPTSTNARKPNSCSTMIAHHGNVFNLSDVKNNQTFKDGYAHRARREN